MDPRNVRGHGEGLLAGRNSLPRVNVAECDSGHPRGSRFIIWRRRESIAGPHSLAAFELALTAGYLIRERRINAQIGLEHCHAGRIADALVQAQSQVRLPRSGLQRQRHRGGCGKVDGRSTEGPVQMRRLGSPRSVQDIVTHAPEDELDIDTRRRHVLQKRRRIGAVLAVAVVGLCAACSRESDKLVIAGLDLGKAATNRTLALARFRQHARSERIVTTGIEDHEPELAGAANHCGNGRKRDGFDVHRCRAGELRIDWYQIVLASNLYAMAGVIDDGDIGAGRKPLELEEGPAKCVSV